MNQQMVETSELSAAPVRCPFCAAPNEPTNVCRHVRWTFEQGDPIEFARFAIETSPYVQARGHSAREISAEWMTAHGDWIVDCVLLHFDANDGYVFGEVSHLDLLARDIWREFHPETERPSLTRVDPI